MVQWKSSSTMVVAGSNTAHYRFPCVTANTVRTQQEQRRSWDEPSATRAPSAAVIDVVQTQQGHRVRARARKAKRLRTQSPEAANQHAKYKRGKRTPTGQTSRWIFLPTHTLQAAPDLRRQSPQQVVKLTEQQDGIRCASAEGQLMGLGCLAPQNALLPSTAAQRVSSL